MIMKLRFQPIKCRRTKLKKKLAPTWASMPNIQVKLWYQNKPIETKQKKPMSNSKQIQCSMMEFKRRLIKKKDQKKQTKQANQTLWPGSCK
jgi:hypothetical protein